MSEDLHKARLEADLGPRQKRLIREDRRAAGTVDSMVERFRNKKAELAQKPKQPQPLAKSDMKPKEDKWKEGEVGGDISKDVVHEGKPSKSVALFKTLQKQSDKMAEMQTDPLTKSAGESERELQDMAKEDAKAKAKEENQKCGVGGPASDKLKKSVRRLGSIDHNGGKIHVMAATERQARHLPALHVEAVGANSLNEDHTKWPKEVHAKIAEAKSQGARRVIVHEPQGNTVYHQSTMAPAKPALEKNMGMAPPPPPPGDFGPATPPTPVIGTNAQPLAKANPLQPPKVPGVVPQKSPKPMAATKPSKPSPGTYGAKTERVQKSKDIPLVPNEKHLWKPTDKSSEMDKLAKGDVVELPKAKHPMATHNHPDMPAILASKGQLPQEHVKLLHQAINESDALHNDPAEIPQDVLDYHNKFLHAAIGRLEDSQRSGKAPAHQRAKLHLAKSKLVKSGRWQVPGMVPPKKLEKAGCAAKLAKCTDMMRQAKLAKTTPIAPVASAPVTPAGGDTPDQPAPVTGGY